MNMRGQPALGFDRGEVLDLEPGAAAQVLHPPVHQLGEVHRVQRGAPVVIPGRVNRHPLTAHDPAVGGNGQGDEHRGPVHLPVRSGETLAHRPGLHRAHRQIRGITTTTGRAHHPTRTATVDVILVFGVLVSLEVVADRALEVGVGQLVDAVPPRRTDASAAPGPASHTSGTATPESTHRAGPPWTPHRSPGPPAAWPAGAHIRPGPAPTRRPWPCPSPAGPARPGQHANPVQPQRRWEPRPSKPPLKCRYVVFTVWVDHRFRD
jgi:hypothetical protein